MAREGARADTSPTSKAKRSLARREDAQAMLLGAVLMVTAFLVLIVLTGRIANLGSTTLAATDHSFLLDVSQVDAAAREAAEASAGLPAATFTTQWSASLGHLAVLEASRGHHLEVASATCFAGIASATLQFSDGLHDTTWTLQHDVTGMGGCP